MYIADLHTHSRYSRATSKECTPEYLDLWARRKGIHLIGSGDFTHPAWREELKEKLNTELKVVNGIQIEFEFEKIEVGTKLQGVNFENYKFNRKERIGSPPS